MSQTVAAKSSWKASNIFFMILGFIFFWPLGLAMLAYMIWGEEMREMFKDFKSRIDSEFASSGCGRRHRSGSHHGFAKTGNVAFDEYRKSELERLEEERRKLEAEKAEFEDFLVELRRVKDQEEFERFMKRRHNNPPVRESESKPDMTPDA